MPCPLSVLSFLVSAGIHTIITSNTDEELAGPTITGPGGKPLPISKRNRERQAVQSNDDAGAGRGIDWTIFLYLTGGIILSFVANGAAIAAHAMKSSSDVGVDIAWWCGEERTVYFVGSAFLYLYILISLLEWRHSAIVVHLNFWLLSLVGETVILLAFLLAADPESGLTSWDVANLGIGAIRLCLVICSMCLYAAVARRRSDEAQAQDEETSPLLCDCREGLANRSTRYNSTNGGGRRGSNGQADQGYQQQDAEAAFYRPNKLPHKTWFEYCRGYLVFFPYLWPSKSARLQGGS